MARPFKINDQAIQFAVTALSRMVHKGIIKRALSEKFGLAARSSETVIARAREEIRQRAGKSLDELKIDAAAYYQSILSDQNTNLKERLFALEGFVRLFGLARPERIEVSGPNGTAIQTEQKSFDPKNCTPEQLTALRELLAARAKK